MTLFDQAVQAYRSSDAFRATLKDLENGATPDDNHFLQAVSDNAYSVLGKVFDEDQLDEVEVMDVVDAAINS